MRQQFVISRNIPPGRVVSAHRFRIARLLTVIFPVWSIGIDCVNGLLDAPPTSWNNHRILNYVAGFQCTFVPHLVLFLSVISDPLKQKQAISVRIAKADSRQISTFALIELGFFHAEPGSEPGSQQRRPFTNRAMTINTAYFNSRARFVVENPIAVRVLPKVAIDAVHALLKMNVLEMNGFFESIRIVGRNDPILCIQQVPLPIAFEDLTK